MADRYDRSLKVGQSTIDEIKKMGMSEAIKRARAGEGSREFLEGAKRMYGGNRVGYGKTHEAMEPGVQGPHGPGQPSQRKAGPPAPSGTSAPATQNISSTKPAPPQAAVGRRIQGTEGGTSRPEYAGRLKKAKEKGGRAGAIAMANVAKQAEKDTKVRAGRPEQISKLEKQLADLNKRKDKGGRAGALAANEHAEKTKKLNEAKSKLKYE